MALQPLTADGLSGASSIRHGFFTRHGGVSTGLFAGLNCGRGSDDRLDDVLENRARVAGHFGINHDHLLTLYQLHSPTCLTVTGPWPDGASPKADAMATATLGVALAILTADCGPVLFADPEAGVIGAAHAGWKGAMGGVLEATIDTMEDLGADRRRIVTALGPTISQAAYEVGPEFHTRFVEDDAANAGFFTPSDRENHHRFDLPGYIAMRLTAAGVTRHDDLAACTYANEARFYSYRRTTHRAEPDYGRLISVIMLDHGSR